MGIKAKANTLHFVLLFACSSLLFMGKFHLVCLVTYIIINFFGHYPYCKASVCPLIIVLKYKPQHYDKMLRRVYGEHYLEVALICYGFVVFFIASIITKIVYHG